VRYRAVLACWTGLWADVLFSPKTSCHAPLIVSQPLRPIAQTRTAKIIWIFIFAFEALRFASPMARRV
jgi:hypothetical protein